MNVCTSLLPEDTTFGVRISGDSMEPEFHDGQIAWVLQQESVANGEIGEQRGIYQDDLAAAIGYSTKTVGRIERGDSTPSAEFMLRISKYFNLLVEDVFHVED